MAAVEHFCLLIAGTASQSAQCAGIVESRLVFRHALLIVRAHPGSLYNGRSENFFSGGSFHCEADD